MLGIESFYQTYKTDVYRYLVSLTRDASISEDLLSETFLRALQRLGSYEERSGIKTWLFGIARNVWLEHLRKCHTTMQYDDMLGMYLHDALAEDAAARQTLARVQVLLAEKDVRTQRLIYLRAQGYSYEEIAPMLQMTQAGARVLEHRTRTWLKQMLQKEGLWNGTTD